MCGIECFCRIRKTEVLTLIDKPLIKFENFRQDFVENKAKENFVEISFSFKTRWKV